MHSWKLRRAARVIHSGGVIAYPTEAVWGLGCNPADAFAVQRIWQLKGRAAEKGLILIASHLDLLLPWISPPSEEHLQTLKQPCERPVTWVVTAHAATPPWLTGNRPTLAIRITDHPLVGDLCRASQLPLVSTSANPAGRPPARSALAIRHYFDDGVDLIVHGALGDARRPSEIRDLNSGRILRPG